MGLLKRAHVRGMAHELTRRGIVQWPTKMAEEEAADAIADELPEEVMPEETGEDGLSPEQAQAALQQIVEVAEEIAEKTGGQIFEDTQKLAAASSYEDAASHAAISLMEKAAEETAVATGPDVPGQSAPAPELGATAEGEIDAVTNPSADVVVPQGTTEVDTKPGAVGAEEIRPEQPGAEGTPPSGEAAKTASQVLDMLQKLAAVDGASLSGGAAQGPAPAARVDLDDNLNIPGVVAKSQGTTTLEVPAAANIGVTKKQPAGNPGPTAATPNEPAKDAVKKAMDMLRSTPEGAALISKIAEEEEKKKKDEEECKKDEEEDKKEQEKEAHLHTALQHLANALS